MDLKSQKSQEYAAREVREMNSDNKSEIQYLVNLNVDMSYIGEFLLKNGIQSVD